MVLKEGFIICNNELKEKILKNNKDFKNYIFLTLDALREKLFFSVEKKAVYFLMKKYNFSYDLALEYFKYVKYIEDKCYNNPKLDSLVSSYHYLLENNLIKKDNLFLLKLKQFEVGIVNPIEQEYIKVINEIKKYTNYYEIDYKVDQNNKIVVNEYNTILEESLAVFNSIKNLLASGISLNHIYIANASSDYQFIFKRLAKSYKISMNFKPATNLLSRNIIRQFLALCNEDLSFYEIIDKLDKNDPLYNRIISTLNDYKINDLKPKDMVVFLTAIFKNMACEEKKYSEAISFIDEEFIPSDDDYIFYVGFNLNSAPKIEKETGFLTDEELKILGISTSYEKNELAYKRITDFIMGSKNIKVSYKLSANNSEFFPSLLINRLNLEVIRPDVDFGYAKIEDDLRLSCLYDDYLKYGNLNKDLAKYGLGKIKYKEYKHKFTGIDNQKIIKRYEDTKLKLAYSNVKLYFACPFSYYADRILNLAEFKPQMAARLGSYAHQVLEDSYKLDFDFEKSVALSKLRYSTDYKDDFFFEQMQTVLRGLISFNKKHEQQSLLKEIKTEEHIVIDNDLFVFEGFIDKLMYYIDGDNVYAAIIDYKTGKDIVSLDNIEDGFHLQLPSYMYLLANYEPFNNLNLHIIGIYLQKVNIVILDNKSDKDIQMNKKFMLEGYTVADPSLIKYLDANFVSSDYIKSLGMTKDGFRSYSKIFAAKKQDQIIEMVKKLLDKAANGIKSGSFEIAPKIIDGVNESCCFCKYKDICFCDYSDEVQLEYKPFLKE